MSRRADYLQFAAESSMSDPVDAPTPCEFIRGDDGEMAANMHCLFHSWSDFVTGEREDLSVDTGGFHYPSRSRR